MGDAGACGIVAPMINNKEDAQRLVDQCRYAPKGKRSWGPTRALAGDITPEQANEYVKVFAMIETREAIENLDSILDLEGVDLQGLLCPGLQLRRDQPVTRGW